MQATEVMMKSKGPDPDAPGTLNLETLVNWVYDHLPMLRKTKRREEVEHFKSRFSLLTQNSEKFGGTKNKAYG